MTSVAHRSSFLPLRGDGARLLCYCSILLASVRVCLIVASASAVASASTATDTVVDQRRRLLLGRAGARGWRQNLDGAYNAQWDFVTYRAIPERLD